MSETIKATVITTVGAFDLLADGAIRTAGHRPERVALDAPIDDGEAGVKSVRALLRAALDADDANLVHRLAVRPTGPLEAVDSEIFAGDPDCQPQAAPTITRGDELQLYREVAELRAWVEALIA